MLKIYHIIFLILIIVPSCKNTPTNPMQSNLSMEIISYKDAPTTVDSNLCFIKLFVEWNKSSWRDTLKADSLAQWFANSRYQITDMWFPNVETLCLHPINTENIVSLKLAQPDSTLKLQGYFSTSSVVSVCYPNYRHYKFTRIKGGI